jgi:hypothetical protein
MGHSGPRHETRPKLLSIETKQIRREAMTKFLVSAAVLAFPILLLATPSHATIGIDAARACEANPKCIATYDDSGGVTILIGDKIIDCPGPKKECTISRTRPGKGNSVTANFGSTTTTMSRR